MKYIVTTNEDLGEEIFLFPRSVNHSIIAEEVSSLRNQRHGDWRRVQRKVVSAGFVEGGKCVGRSESLGIGSRPQDSELLVYLT